MNSNKTSSSRAACVSSAVSALALLFFGVSCEGVQVGRNQPLGASSGGSYPGSNIVREQAASYGSTLSPKAEQELDSYLAKAMEMKKEVETHAAALKRDFPTKPEVSAKGMQKYQVATNALQQLKASVQSDFQVHQGITSAATEQAAKDFESAGNDLRFYYAEVTQQGRFGTAFLVVLDIINELKNIWASYGEAQRQAYLTAVERRLSPKDWAQL